MERIIFNYDEWLSGHASRKTMMEKLERSLVPFEIFEAIGHRVGLFLSRQGYYIVLCCSKLFPECLGTDGIGGKTSFASQITILPQSFASVKTKK